MSGSGEPESFHAPILLTHACAPSARASHEPEFLHATIERLARETERLRCAGYVPAVLAQRALYHGALDLVERLRARIGRRADRVARAREAQIRSVDEFALGEYDGPLDSSEIAGTQWTIVSGIDSARELARPGPARPLR